MFKWFKKNKNETSETKIEKRANYIERNNGNIEICLGDCFYTQYVVIPKSSISSHTEDVIVFERHEKSLNHSLANAIEDKVDSVQLDKTLAVTCVYHTYYHYWEIEDRKIVATKEVSRKSPLEVFVKNYESKYKLIETEDEFSEYLSSTLDCDTWCRKKLYTKMKELGLGDGFINQFADLIGNDLDKYHAMIDLANETSDKDTLMYLYTYKFGKDN